MYIFIGNVVLCLWIFYFPYGAVAQSKFSPSPHRTSWAEKDSQSLKVRFTVDHQEQSSASLSVATV